MKTITSIRQKEKIALFKQILQNEKNMKIKIREICYLEYDELLIQILLLEENIFINQLENMIKVQIELNFTEESLLETKIEELINYYISSIKKTYYQQDKSINNKAWSEYEANVNAIKKLTKNPSMIKKNVELSYLKDFYLHCNNQNSQALHTCGGQFLEVYCKQNDGKQSLSFVICVNCKYVYTKDCILMNCPTCKVNFYSKYMTKEEKSNDFLPASWEKYHCNTIIADPMKCLKCNDLLYISKNKGILKCKTCSIETKPMSINWNCILCKTDFNCNAKIHCQVEFKIVKDAIKESLIKKISCKPINVPCCKINIDTSEFIHKKECNGLLYKGELLSNSIVVCEKCKAMNYYDKFIWTCPICFKKFRQKDKSEEYTSRDRSISYNFPTSRIVSSQPKLVNMASVNLNENDKSFKEDYIKNEQIYLKDNQISVFKNSSEKIKVNSPKMTERSISNNLINQSKKQSNYLLNILEERKQENSNKVYKIKSKFDNNNLEDNLYKLPPNTTREISQDIVKASKLNKEKIQNEKIDSINHFQLEENKLTKEKENKQISVAGSNSKAEKTKSKFNSKEIKVEQNNIKEVIEKINPDLVKTESIVKEKDKNEIKETNIDNFKMSQLIGEGTYGKIYRVIDGNGNKFAMKKIICHEINELKSTKKEFELIMNNPHPNIIKIEGMCEKKLDETTFALYVVLELADSDWEKEISKKAKTLNFYKEKELITILKQLCSCLAFLQSKNVSHRDIKPQNILVLKGEYKLADFGEAKQSKSYNSKNTLRGTELYMSPILFERLREEALGVTQNIQVSQEVLHNTYKSDVFSLGYCMIFAATLTFDSISSMREIYNIDEIKKILKGWIRKRYSDKFISLILSMIDLNEEKRLDFYQLEDELRNFKV